MTVAEMSAARAKHIDAMAVLAKLADLTDAQVKEFDDAEAAVKALDASIARTKTAEALQATLAQPVGVTTKTAATVKSDAYEKDSSIVVGGMLRMMAVAKGHMNQAVETAIAQYGENHPVALAMVQTKAQNTMTGSAGGFVIPPDFVDSIIPLLYAKTVVRQAGALTMPMPNGTMTIPKMTGGSAASWIGEAQAIGESGPAWGQVVATAHKLAALVPVSNDQMRYAMPQYDTMLRNDIVKQISLAEDAAFIRGIGTQYSPKGLKSFALSGQTITSTYAYTLTTVNNELAGLVNKLESANLPLSNVGWLMSPRTKNYLLNVLNGNGFYVYKTEMTAQKTLLGYPFYTTTEIPNTLTIGGNANCSELYLVDFGETMILESRQLEFAISTEGTYKDANGVMQSAFQNDLTIIRAIMAEDFQLRHDEAVAFNQGVAWAPTLS